MKRKYPRQPIVGVGGILFHNESVLLVKRGREPAMGQWSIPGGVVDLGETLGEAVVREVLEETHVKAEPLALVRILDRIFRDKERKVAYHYVLVDFLCRHTGGEVHPGSDAADAQFIPVEDLASLDIIPVAREVIYQAGHLWKNPEIWNPPSPLTACYDLSHSSLSAIRTRGGTKGIKRGHGLRIIR